MEEKTIAAGVISLVVGFAVGNLTAGSGPDPEEIEALVSEQVAASTDAVSGMAASVESQFAALGDRLSGLEEQLGAATDTSALDDIGARIDTLATDIQAGLSEQKDAMASGMAALGDRISTRAESAVAQITGDAADAPADSEAASETAEAAAPAEESATAEAAATSGLSVGQTAMLADGQLRVFVSRITDDGVRAVANGEVVTLEPGGSAMAGDCEVSLDAMSDGKAEFSGSCGAASGDGDAAAAADQTTDAAPAESDEGTRIGSTAILGDGAARVFVSGIAADGGTARVAVNGVGVRSVASGDAIEIGEEGCSVTVDAIHASSVSFDYGCDS